MGDAPAAPRLEAAGDRDGAAAAFTETLALSPSEPEQAYLRHRLDRIVAPGR